MCLPFDASIISIFITCSLIYNYNILSIKRAKNSIYMICYSYSGLSMQQNNSFKYHVGLIMVLKLQPGCLVVKTATKREIILLFLLITCVESHEWTLWGSQMKDEHILKLIFVIRKVSFWLASSFISPNKQNAQIKGNRYFPAQKMPATKSNSAQWLELLYDTSLKSCPSEKLWNDLCHLYCTYM